MLCLDLDRFKNINDSLGHSAGDRLLIGLIGDLRPVPPAILAEGRGRDAAARRGEAMPETAIVPMAEQA